MGAAPLLFPINQLEYQSPQFVFFFYPLAGVTRVVFPLVFLRGPTPAVCYTLDAGCATFFTTAPFSELATAPFFVASILTTENQKLFSKHPLTSKMFVPR